jgi:5-methylcytosine-specific restriction enzyme subunit McrC
MRQETLVESAEAVLSLTSSEAAALVETGSRLASRTAWWGEKTPPVDRSIIAVRHQAPGRYAVRVSDAVGVVVVGSLHILVQPKIPMAHLIYLLSMSGRVPRLDRGRSQLSAGESLWALVATWFITSTETLLHRGLVRDYRRTVAEMQAARGHLLPLHTTQAFYSGRLAVRCAFDDFCFDSPLNRVLRAAAREVVASPLLDWPLRRRAMTVLDRMGDASELQAGDTEKILDRQTRHYEDAWVLASHVMSSTGRVLAHGPDKAWAFLLRTPEMVEDGIRALLAKGLGLSRVQKRGIQLAGSSMTFNPDLLFDYGTAVGDVKYKLSKGDWDRPDVNQAITFAEAFGASSAAILRFRYPGTPKLADAIIGKKLLSELTWVVSDQSDPVAIGERLLDDTRAWLERARSDRQRH